MGILKFLRNLGNADSTREAVRLSYMKHSTELLNRDPSTDPHATALWGVLATRYRLRGELKGEIETWSDLTPFLAMGQTIAVKALAEYIVLLERPTEANTPWLSQVIKQSIRAPGPHLKFAYLAYLNRPAWTNLLSEDDLQCMLNLQKEMEEEDDDEWDELDDEIEDEEAGSK